MWEQTTSEVSSVLGKLAGCRKRALKIFLKGMVRASARNTEVSALIVPLRYSQRAW